MHSRLIDDGIALVGPPNAGKTTLYNWLTGSKYKPVNYPGSTVEYLSGVTLGKYGPTLRILDTPGIRSLNPTSPEEKVTLEALKNPSSIGSFNLLIIPVDATQLTRHLLLVFQLREADYPIIVALTMCDLLKERNLKINVHLLSQKLGLPVIEVDGRLGGGIPSLFQKIQEIIPQISHKTDLTLQSWSDEKIKATYFEIDQIVNEVTNNKNHKLQSADPKSLLIDKWLMHPIYGFFFFFLIMMTLFASIFYLATPFMDGLDQIFSYFGDLILTLAPNSLWTDFISNGLITGIASVAIFIPQIIILFFGISILEDTGYLARAATLVDRPLSLIGLNGRSFVPLLSGFACAIPAMMAARTITHPRDRLLTLFIIPLMSCSARLPVYALLLSFLFSSPFTAALALTLLYFGSIFMGSLVAGLLHVFWKSQKPSWLMLELPTYRKPQLGIALHVTFDRTMSYIKRAGGIILFISMTIWFLTTFPAYKESDKGEKLKQSYAAQVGHFIDPIMTPMGGDWRVGVGLLSAFAAREVFVSSLALIFHIDDTADDETIQTGLLTQMKLAKKSDGTLLFTNASVTGLLIFFLISLQCLSTVAVSRAESGKKWFALSQLILFNILGYSLAVITYQWLSI